MLNPLSGPVLGSSAVLSLPALVAAWRGSLPFETALTRFLVVLLACWLGMSAVAKLWRASANPPASPRTGPVRKAVPTAAPARKQV